MSFQYKKTASATVTYVDRGRQNKKPASWAVYKNGEHIGNIISGSYGYRESPEYVLVTPTFAVVKSFIGKTLAEAKTWIEKSI
jgi:hypothetical protein